MLSKESIHTGTTTTTTKSGIKMSTYKTALENKNKANAAIPSNKDNGAASGRGPISGRGATSGRGAKHIILGTPNQQPGAAPA